MVLYKMKDTFPSAKHHRPRRDSPQPWNTTIVVSYFKGDIRWTQRLSELGYHVCVYTHALAAQGPYNIPYNVGREASVYLKYMRDYYHSLRDYTVFLHDEEHAWHHDGSLVDLITQKLSTLRSPMYVNFNNRCTGSIYNGMWPMIQAFFHKYLAPYIGPIEPYGNWTQGGRCCAQFIVHHSRIRRHPHIFYDNLYRYVTRSRKNDPIGLARAHCLEWTWAIIFGLGPSRRSNSSNGPSCPQPTTSLMIGKRPIKSQAKGFIR